MTIGTSMTIALVASGGALLMTVPACDTEDATLAEVVNDYPVIARDDDAGAPADIMGPTSLTVFKAWWGTALFVDGVVPGATSGPQRTTPQTAYAYALLAPGWDPSNGGPPTSLIAVRSNVRLSSARGQMLSIRVSDLDFTGRCGATPLSQTDADFITQRIFPAEFAGGHYDAATCVFTSDAADAASPEGGMSSDASPLEDGASAANTHGD